MLEGPTPTLGLHELVLAKRDGRHMQSRSCMHVCRAYVFYVCRPIHTCVCVWGGGSFRDPLWVPLKSTNARVLCSYGGLIP